MALANRDWYMGWLHPKVGHTELYLWSSVVGHGFDWIGLDWIGSGFSGNFVNWIGWNDCDPVSNL